TDDQLADIIDSAKHYCNDLDRLTNAVRAAIVEEICADNIAHDLPHVAAEMQKLTGRKRLTNKDRKRFAELIRLSITESRKRAKPNKADYVGLWSDVRDSDEG